MLLHAGKNVRVASLLRQLSFCRQPSWVLRRLGIRIHEDTVLAHVIGKLERLYGFTLVSVYWELAKTQELMSRSKVNQLLVCAQC